MGDLTKMGDIVRSRTYAAFFPLIAVTVIYFVLEGLFSFAVSRVRVSIDPKKCKRESILKGNEPPTTARGRNFVSGEIMCQYLFVCVCNYFYVPFIFMNPHL